MQGPLILMWNCLSGFHLYIFFHNVLCVLFFFWHKGNKFAHEELETNFLRKKGSLDTLQMWEVRVEEWLSGSQWAGLLSVPSFQPLLVLLCPTHSLSFHRRKLLPLPTFLPGVTKWASLPLHPWTPELLSLLPTWWLSLAKTGYHPRERLNTSDGNDGPSSSPWERWRRRVYLY